jgi:subtilase family serine protease
MSLLLLEKGFILEENYMNKKLSGFVLLGLLGGALAACSGGSADSTSASLNDKSVVALAAKSQPHALATRHIHAASQQANGAAALSALPANQTMSLSILLALGDEAGLDAALADIYNPQSANYRHYLSGAEFTARFGPSQANHDALVAYLQANNLAVTSTAANRLVINVTGKVSDVEKVFHVKMGTYQHPTEARTYFGPDREPTLDVATPVWRVAGLDNFATPRPLVSQKLAQAKPLAGTGPGGYYTGTDIRNAYLPGTSLNGAGQSVALFQFGGYYTGDLQTYFNNTGFNNTVPVNNILLDGYSMCSAACDDTEQVLDVAQAVTVAPGLSQVRVYIGGSDVDIFNAMATDNISKTISISWTWGPADPGSDDPILKQLAAQGQTVFAASGDGGAFTSSSSYPADDVNVTAVGGTDLTTASAGGAWSSETAWSDSGGGYINSQPIPSWQVAAINSTNHGSTTLRNVPDVSAEANFDNYACGNGSCGGGWGGTSFASPRWAAFVALVNQQAAAAGKPPVGFLNATIYSIGAGANYHNVLHDITSGSNGSFSANAAYDLVTGWGSPNGQAFLNTLSGTGITSGATYVLVNPNSNKALDVYSASTADGAIIDIWDINGTVAQKWTVNRNSDGSYTLVNPNSNKALDVYHSGNTDGSVVDIWDQNGTGAQKWTINSNSDGTYTLVNPESNKALDVYSASTSDGGKIDIWDINGTVAQKWNFVPTN